MNVKLNYKMSKDKRFVFSLCTMDAKKLTWVFIGIFVFEQLLSASVEYLIFGEIFHHWFDSLITGFIGGSYFYYLHALGDFLLKLITESEASD